MNPSVYANRVVFNATSAGTGSFIVASAATGFRTPAAAVAAGDLADGARVSYTAESADKTQFEFGQGIYTNSTVTLTRTTIRGSSNPGGIVNFTSVPKVWFDVQAEDLQALADASDSNLGMEFVFQNGGNPLVALMCGDLEVQSDCTISSVTMVTDQVGSIVINIWKCTFAQFDNSTHPVAGDKITASAPPTISSGVSYHDTTLTGWTRSLSKGDILRFNIDSSSTVTRASISLTFLGAGPSSDTGVVQGTYGDATHVAQYTVGLDGRILASANVPITIGAGTPAILTEAGTAAKASTFTTVTPVGGDLITGLQGGANKNFTAASIAALGSSGSGLPTGQFNPAKVGSNGTAGVWIQDIVDAGNPIFGNIKTSPRSTIQAAVDYCFANGYNNLHIPIFSAGGSYSPDGPIYFDPPANLRSGISLANQLLGVTAVPSVFGFGLNVAGDLNTTFNTSYQTAPCFWVGTQNNNTLSDLTGIGPRGGLGANLRQLDPRSAFIAIASGNGGAVKTEVIRCNSRDFYAHCTLGQNGQSALAEDNVFYDNLAVGNNIGLDVRNSQAFANKIFGGSWAGCLATYRNVSQGIEIFNAESGIVNTFQLSITGLTPSVLSAVATTLAGGTSFNTYSFTTSASSALADGTFFFNSGIITLPSFGPVPITQNATGWTIDPGWCYYHFGEEVALKAGTDFDTELVLVTSILASTRGTVFVGLCTADGRTHVESNSCIAFYNSNGGVGTSAFTDMEVGNWHPGSGSDVNTTAAIINRHFPAIKASSGDFVMRNTLFPGQQQGSVPIVIEGFDLSNNQYFSRFIIEGCSGFKNTNMRYVGDSSTPTGGSITRGVGYDNTLASNGHIATKAFGFGEWDFCPWSYGGNGLNFLEVGQGNGQMFRISGTGHTRYDGYRPSRNQHLRMTTADVTALIGLTGTIPSICGGFPVEIAQIGTTASTGGPATSGTADVHRMIDVGGAGFSYYAGGVLGASLGITWSCKGQTQMVFLTGGATAFQYLYPGLEIGLTTDAGNIWYVVTGTYLFETAPYITVYRESTSASVISGVKTTTYTGATMAQRAPIPSFPGQLRTARVGTQFDKTSSTTLGDVTNLTKQVFAGLKYKFNAVLFTTSNVAGGVKAAVAGTCTATAIVYEGQTTDPAGVQLSSRGTALATAVGAVTAVTAARIDIEGLIRVATSGTLTIQFAQNASNGTASSVLVDSYMEISEVP